MPTSAHASPTASPVIRIVCRWGSSRTLIARGSAARGENATTAPRSPSNIPKPTIGSAGDEPPEDSFGAAPLTASRGCAAGGFGGCWTGSAALVRLVWWTGFGFGRTGAGGAGAWTIAAGGGGGGGGGGDGGGGGGGLTGSGGGGGGSGFGSVCSEAEALEARTEAMPKPLITSAADPRANSTAHERTADQLPPRVPIVLPPELRSRCCLSPLRLHRNEMRPRLARALPPSGKRAPAHEDARFAAERVDLGRSQHIVSQTVGTRS
jgi:hypothetical protein